MKCYAVINEKWKLEKDPETKQLYLFATKKSAKEWLIETDKIVECEISFKVLRK